MFHVFTKPSYLFLKPPDHYWKSASTLTPPSVDDVIFGGIAFEKMFRELEKIFISGPRATTLNPQVHPPLPPSVYGTW